MYTVNHEWFSFFLFFLFCRNSYESRYHAAAPFPQRPHHRSYRRNPGFLFVLVCVESPIVCAFVFSEIQAFFRWWCWGNVALPRIRLPDSLQNRLHNDVGLPSSWGECINRTVENILDFQRRFGACRSGTYNMVVISQQ